MKNRIKITNTICVLIVGTVLSLAMALTSLALFSDDLFGTQTTAPSGGGGSIGEEIYKDYFGDVEIPSNIEYPSELFSGDLPSEWPSELPSEWPSELPSEWPSEFPSEWPSELPSEWPSEFPSEWPSELPSEWPSELPSEWPSEFPSEWPSELPSEWPSEQPSEKPTDSGNIGIPPDVSNENKVAYIIQSDKTDRLYLKEQSFGDYTGNSWTAATQYDSLINGMYSASYLPGLRLEASGSRLNTVKINPQLNQYVYPYFISTLTDTIQYSDVSSVGNAEGIYEVYYYLSNLQDSIPVSDIFAYEEEYRNFVYDNYLYVDIETYRYMSALIAENGWNTYDEDIIQKVALYIQNAASYNLKYDRKLDSESNIAIAFLDEYREGICQHYATAATLLYRSMGIPARYTVGFTAQAIAGQWVNVSYGNAHAWVEVYIDGVGWQYVEVTGSSSAPPPDIEDPDDYLIKDLSIRPERVEKQYDGNPLTPVNSIIGFEEWEKKGYSYSVVVSGEAIYPGIYQSKIESVTFYDPDHNDITSRVDYNAYVGTMHVYICELYFVSDAMVKEYDGKVFETYPENYSLHRGELEDGYTYRITPEVTAVNVGNGINSFSVEILDAEGVNISTCYKIIKVCGVLEITPVSLVMKAKDASKIYDGTALMCNEIEMISGMLAEGDRLANYEVIGSQTEIGRSENIIDISSVLILNEDNENVTSNYQIELQNGKLRVTKG